MERNPYRIIFVSAFCIFIFLSFALLEGSSFQLDRIKASLFQLKKYDEDIENFKAVIEGLSKDLIEILNSQGKNDLAQEIERLKVELMSFHESDREQYEQTFKMMMKEVDNEIDRMDIEILLIQQKIDMDQKFIERVKRLAEEKAKEFDIGEGFELFVIEASYKLMQIETKMAEYKAKIDETVKLYKSMQPKVVKETTSLPPKVSPPPKSETADPPRKSVPPASTHREGMVYYRGLAVDMWDGEHRVVRVNDTFRGSGTVHTILESSATLALDTMSGTCTGKIRYVHRVVYDDPNFEPEITTIERELRGTFNAVKYLRGPLNGVWLISSAENMASEERTSGLVFKSSNISVQGVPELHGDFILLYLAQRSKPLANQKFFRQLQESGDLSPNYNSEQPVAVLWLE